MVLATVRAACTVLHLWSCSRWTSAEGWSAGEHEGRVHGVSKVCASLLWEETWICFVECLSRLSWRLQVAGKLGMGYTVGKLGRECLDRFLEVSVGGGGGKQCLPTLCSWRRLLKITIPPGHVLRLVIESPSHITSIFQSAAFVLYLSGAVFYTVSLMAGNHFALLCCSPRAKPADF